jgi:hypothetical protein
MPKTILQSNWYYEEEFGRDIPRVLTYHELEERGYDQMPTGSNHSNDVNFGLTVDYTGKLIGPDRLFGYLQTPWRPTLPEYRDHHMAALNQVDAAWKSLGAES